MNDWSGLIATDTRPRRIRIRDDALLLWSMWQRVRRNVPLPTKAEIEVQMGWTERRVRTAYKRLTDRGLIELRKHGANVRHYKRSDSCE